METLKLCGEHCEYEHFPGEGTIAVIMFTKEPMALVTRLVTPGLQRASQAQ